VFLILLISHSLFSLLYFSYAGRALQQPTYMQMEMFPPLKVSPRVCAMLTLPGQLVPLQIPCFAVPSYTKKDGKVRCPRLSKSLQKTLSFA
jgi:hypothetical protein